MRHKVVIKWYTTPKELRELTNLMEEMTRTLLPGESNLITELNFGNFSVEVRYNQESIAEEMDYRDFDMTKTEIMDRIVKLQETFNEGVRKLCGLEY